MLQQLHSTEFIQARTWLNGPILRSTSIYNCFHKMTGLIPQFTAEEFNLVFQTLLRSILQCIQVQNKL